MPPLRPALNDPSRSSDSSVILPVKFGPLNGVSVCLIQQKLQPEEITSLLLELEQLGATPCTEPSTADVVVTAITMRRRLERHLTWTSALARDVVTPQWITECARTRTRVSPQLFRAIREPEPRGTKRKLSDTELRQDLSTQSQSQSQSQGSQLVSLHSPTASSSAGTGSPSSPKRSSLLHVTVSSKPPSPGHRHIASTSTSTSTTSATFSFTQPRPNGTSPPVPNSRALPPADLLKTKFSPLETYAVQRLHPMICPNQALIADLSVIRRQRELEGEDRSALSYARVIAALKAQPYKLTFNSKLKEIPFVGEKIRDKVEEFIESGSIAEAAEYRASERYKTLVVLTSIHGIGATKARDLYGRGIKTLDDCDRLYGVTVPNGYGGWVPNDDLEALDDGSQADSIIREALSIRTDLAQKIPRAEVEDIAATIGHELQEIEPGCVWEICGGYRRGKAESNDVDIVFTHPEGRRIPGLCTRLVDWLMTRDMITRSWSHLQTFHKPKPGATPRLPGLDKSLLVYQPDKSHPARRVDLIFCKPEVFWVAVVGWTGSIMFERDIRVWASKKGFKFNDSGILRLRNTEFISVRSEEEVFEILGLQFIEPRWRNADM